MRKLVIEVDVSQSTQQEIWWLVASLGNLAPNLEQGSPPILKAEVVVCGHDPRVASYGR